MIFKHFQMTLALLVFASLACSLSNCRSKSSLPDHLQDIARNIPKQVDFNFHVKPILSDRCFNCHGPDEENLEAGLRLDDPESAFGPLENQPGRFAIVPGNAKRSELVKRILSDDPELVMPPPDSKLSLNDMDRAILISWIDQGAEYKKHWSFQPLDTSVQVPEGHPIDFFISRKLDALDLKKNSKANKESLVRRAAFDLTGLPPSVEEVEKFVNDESLTSFSRLIDQLLASPAYGERMAADWMDVARYADSDGYLDDKHREFSPWRDWVINAFNENMPYDRFVTWQLAGDLIPDKSQESILATAFNRLHRKNSEAGIVFEEYRVEYVADRVNTFSKAFLGLTIECARCHDHKYDPITQKEYYQLFSFFNSTNEIGTAVYGPKQTPGPSLLLTSAEQEEVLGFVNRKIKKQEIELARIEEGAKAEDLDRSFSEIQMSEIEHSHENKLVAYHPFEDIDLKNDGKKMPTSNEADARKPATMYQPRLGEGVSGKAFYVEDYNYVLLGDKVGWYDRQDPFSVSLWLKPAENYHEAGIFTHCEDIRLGYKGYSLHLEDNHLRFIMAFSWPTNAIEIISDTLLSPGKWSHIAITYDGSSVAQGIQIYINGKLATTKVVVDNLYKGILFEPDIHTYGFAGFRLGYRDKIKPFKGGGIDEVKIFNDRLSPLEIQYDFDAQGLSAIMQQPNEYRDFLESFYFLNIDPKYGTVLDTLHTLRSELNRVINDIEEIMVMSDLEQPRPTFLLRRGLYSARGEEVFAGVPKALETNFDQYPKNRLGLANWLFDKQNPLTARVYVNRLWQQHFGQGLVSTAEDFGAQAAIPSHPQLLDFLAKYFIKSGWDIKAMHKLILTSEAYQRSSATDSVALRSDPKNIWLARGPSQRLSAEMIRDNALALSGLLVMKQGGVSVYPYQPAGLWDEISNKSWRYPYLQQAGEGLYRRSLYTIWKRTAPPPSMLLFDVPDRSFCSVQRRETNTPLQALVLLNDPQYIEACREIAKNTSEVYESVSSKLENIFKLIFTRKPTSIELRKIENFYKDELFHINQGDISVDAFLGIGEAGLDADVDRNAITALAITAHNLLNTFVAQMKK